MSKIAYEMRVEPISVLTQELQVSLSMGKQKKILQKISQKRYRD